MQSSAAAEPTPPLQSVGTRRRASAPKTLHGSLPPDRSRGSGPIPRAGGGEQASQDADQVRRTWGTTELSRAFADAYCTGKRLSPTDRLLVLELYAMCHWPDVPAPPATATTYPVTYAFVGMRIGLTRSGAERAVERLRERAWVSTELDDASGFLVYTVHVGKILKDLESWGRWSIRDALGARPPSRRDRPRRSERWGRAPRLPHLRHRPQAMPVVDLVQRWRGLWPEAPDPTATLAALLQEGTTPKQLHRALDSLEASGLGCPRPSFIRDRIERGAYREGGPIGVPAAADPPPASEPSAPEPAPAPAAVAPPVARQPVRVVRREGTWAPPPPAGGHSPAFALGPARGRSGSALGGSDPEPGGSDPERAAARAKFDDFWSAQAPEPKCSRGPSRSGDRSARRPPPVNGPPAAAGSAPETTPTSVTKPAKPPDGNANWTSTALGNRTASGHAQERARTDIPRTTSHPEQEGEL